MSSACRNQRYDINVSLLGSEQTSEESDTFNSTVEELSSPIAQIPSTESQDLSEDSTSGKSPRTKKIVILNNIAVGFILIAYNILYVLSLGTCPYSYDDPNICIGYFRQMYPVWLGETLLAGILMFVLIMMASYKYVTRYWLLFALANFMVLFFLQGGNTMKDHGVLNRTVLLITLCVLSSWYLIFIGFKKVYRCSKILFCSIFILFMLSGWLFYFSFVKNSCEGWETGMGGHKLSNEGDQCKVLVPTYCELGIRNNWFDFSKYTKQCSDTHNSLNKQMLNEKLRAKEDIKRLGFPRVESFDDQIKVNKTGYRDYIRESIIDMDDPTIPQEVKDNIEYVLDVSDDQHHRLELELKPNQTRAREQQELREKVISQEKIDGTYENRVDKNVLIIYIDNLSRAHFYRKLPKTAEWLSQFVDNQESDLKTFQYFRYHSVFYNTIFSNNAMYYGEIEHVKDTSLNLFDSYARNGYMTGFFKDSCESNSNSIHDPNMKLHHWDHFGGGITCDSNYDDHDFTSLTIFEGKSSAIRRCFYGKNMHEYQIDYLKQFWAAYPDNRKFFRTHFSEAHELVGELVKHSDEDIRDLLQYFLDMNYLEDTFVTFVADHGAHALTLRFPAFPDNSRYIENYFPVLVHLTKTDIPAKSLLFLEENEQSFISSHDVYSSLKSIAENKRSVSKATESYSYISEQVPGSHDCADSSAFLADCWCSQDEDAMKQRVSEKGLFYSKV